MAATSDITLADHSATNKTFTPAVQVKNGYQYGDTSAAAASPRTLTVKHVMGSPGVLGSVDVHSLSFAKTAADDAGNPRTASVTVTLRVPHSGPSAADRLDLVAFTKAILSDVNVAKLEIGGF